MEQAVGAASSLRRLLPGDEAELAAFLHRHESGSMLLLSYLDRAGLGYEGRPFEAVWAARMRAGGIAGVAAHAWDGTLILQAPEAAGMLAEAVISLSGRPVAAALGPQDQLEEARSAPRLMERKASSGSSQILYALDLDRLRLPAALAREHRACRRAAGADLELLVGWRIDFLAEAHAAARGARLEARSREQVAALLASGDWFVLEDGARPVACCCFNARLPHAVQIGSVWTPPELRRRGYGRSVVAGALETARREGVRRAVLFTGWDNLPARRAYEPLGFARAGEYGFLFFAP